MTKNQKFLQQYNTAKAGVELLQNQVQLTTNYNELLEVLNTFNSYMQKVANEQNNAPNKSIIAFTTFFQNEVNTKRSFEQVKNNAKRKLLAHKISWRDYEGELLILRKRGYSWRELERYAKEHFKVKVSKDTLRNNLEVSE